MSWRARARGRVINTYLRAARHAPGGRSAEFYFQPDDPYSYLLAQLVPGLSEVHGAALSTEVVVSPPPAANPEPELRLHHAVRDCVELARYYELDFPADPKTPSREMVIRAAAEIARGADPAKIGHALWTADEGALPPASEAQERSLGEGTARLKRRGHYMGGMIRVGRRWCWGVDRLHYAEAALGGTPRLLRRRPRNEWPLGKPASELDFYFSFRSPYSYLALERTLALPVPVRIKPVLPMVMRGLEVPRAKRLYIVHDAKREADRLGIPFGRICDPVGVGVERCLAVFPYAEAEGKGGAFLVSAARGIWSEALDVASDADLRSIVERAGLRWDRARSAMQDTAWRERAERNRLDLFGEGLWGVPSYRLGDYRTWGQDRIWILAAKLSSVSSQTPDSR